MTPISAPGAGEAGLAAAGPAARPGPGPDLCVGRPVGRHGLECRPPPGAKNRIILLFGLNALLNILRSELFFGPHRPDWALGHAPDLAHRELAARPLPRLGETFAGILLLAVVCLNAPLGAS